MKEADEYLRGKYYQWRAYLVPSPDGKYSPSFYDIELSYRLDPPPKAPLFVKVMSTGDEFIRIRWNKNVEHDIMGYRIYYGVQSNRYDGIIGYINGKRITNDFNSNRNYIDVTYSVVGATIGEWVGGSAGLGLYMLRSKNALATDQVFVAIVITSAISIGLFTLIYLVERIMLPWYHSAQRTEQWEDIGIY